MNREIKFRGKTDHDNQWWYGDLLQRFGNHYIQGDLFIKYLVKSETVGQYTGIKDCNGVEIYEGDLVKQNDEVFEVKYGLQEVDAFEGYGWNLWSFCEYTYATGARLSRETEVVGNIYEGEL